jgi:hypothetical protein
MSADVSTIGPPRKAYHIRPNQTGSDASPRTGSDASLLQDGYLFHGDPSDSSLTTSERAYGSCKSPARMVTFPEEGTMPRKDIPFAGPPSKRRGLRTNRYFAHGKKQLTDAQVEFGRALDRFKLEKNRPFPTYSEVLQILLDLGYRKPAAPDRSPRNLV